MQQWMQQPNIAYLLPYNNYDYMFFMQVIFCIMQLNVYVRCATAHNRIKSIRVCAWKRTILCCIRSSILSFCSTVRLRIHFNSFFVSTISSCLFLHRCHRCKQFLLFFIFCILMLWLSTPVAACSVFFVAPSIHLFLFVVLNFYILRFFSSCSLLIFVLLCMIWMDSECALALVSARYTQLVFVKILCHKYTWIS